MKSRILRRAVSIFAALIVALGSSITAFASDNHAEMYFTNAPEGTVYMDILVPFVWYSGNFTQAQDFTIHSESKHVVIDKNSEIANYAKDGYVSLSAHTNYVNNISFYKDGEMHLILYGNRGHDHPDTNDNRYDVDVHYLKRHFKKIKAAYIDEKGNVLGVTDTYEVRYDSSKEHTFEADGSKLTLIMNSHFRTYYYNIVMRLVLPAIGTIFVVVIVVKWLKGIKDI